MNTSPCFSVSSRACSQNSSSFVLRSFSFLSVSFFFLIVFAELLLVPLAQATDVCGDGRADAGGGTPTGCTVGYIPAIYGAEGCDKLCDGNDGDGDGFNKVGTASVDCDDTDKTIYPGAVTTKGCAGGSWRTCGDNGQFSACQSTAYCPSGCTSCFYLDPVNGSNSADGRSPTAQAGHGPWKSYLMFTTYGSPSKPAGWHQPAAGECFLFAGGTYTDSYAPFGNFPMGMYFQSINGTPQQKIQFLAMPGQRPRLNPPGNATTPIIPLMFNRSSNIVVTGFEVTGNFCDGNSFAPDAGCVLIDQSTNVDVSGMYVHDNDGVRNNNVGGIILSSASNNVSIHNSGIWDNYDHAAVSAGRSGADTNIMVFRGSGNSIRNNTLFYTFASANVSSENIRQKHADYTSSLDISKNVIHRGAYAVSICGPNYVASDNLIADADLAFYIADRGGTSYQLGTQKIQYNTILNTRFIGYNPQKAYNQSGAPAADACSSDVTIGPLVVENNLVVDNRSAYTGENELIAVHRYGPDSLYNDVVTGGKLVFRNNCYFNSTGAPFLMSLFTSNNGDTSCSGRGSRGVDYTSLSAWMAAGYDAGSVSVNPQLDGFLKPTAALCLNKGRSVVGRPTQVTGVKADQLN